MTFVALSAYAACIVAANVLTSRFGMIPTGFGLMVTAGTYAAGLALLARDWLHDAAGRRGVLAAILIGAVISGWLASAALAIASGVAFLVSELADMAVYSPLRRKGWARAVIASNTAGAVVDSLLFLWLAGFPILAAVPGQLVGKVVWATLAPIVIVSAVRRVVPRESINPAGA